MKNKIFHQFPFCCQVSPSPHFILLPGFTIPFGEGLELRPATLCCRIMEDFPPNLDDGEMWLPSDIFLSDVAAPPGANFNFNTANCFSPPDQLSRRLSALSPDHHQPPRLPLPPKVCLFSVTSSTLSLPCMRRKALAFLFGRGGLHRFKTAPCRNRHCTSAVSSLAPLFAAVMSPEMVLLIPAALSAISSDKPSLR